MLSSLHATDATAALHRFLDMGIESFLIASSILGIVAQRLVRRICVACKEPYEPTREALIEARFPWEDGQEIPTLYRAGGCPTCSKTGYRGRLALHEIMPVSEEIERLAVERASAAAIARVAREQGMETLRDDGMAKVLSGVTSLEEILRVVV